MWAIPTGTSSALKKKSGKESQFGVSHPELGSDPPIGSDRDSGRDRNNIQWLIHMVALKAKLKLTSNTNGH